MVGNRDTIHELAKGKQKEEKNKLSGMLLTLRTS